MGWGVLVKQRDNDAKVDFALYERKTLLSKFLTQFKLAFGVSRLKAAAIPPQFFSQSKSEVIFFGQYTLAIRSCFY